MIKGVRGPRSLLRQIREAMASGGPAQTRQGMTVTILARTMVAEVCSIYLRRASGELELFATEGLNPEAVHATRLNPGVGLVGVVACFAVLLYLSDAPVHPNISNRQETGEDPFHAFLGVLLLRGGRTIGVLVVQNRAARVYDEDEVEDLQIVAMVLSEMVAGGELVDLAELKGVEIAPHRPERMKGMRFADGLAMGRAVFHEAPVAPERLLSDDPAAEDIRLKAAVEALRAQIDEMLDGQHGLGGAPCGGRGAGRGGARDRGGGRGLEDAVRSGLTAAAAVERVRNEHRARFAPARDPYIRERLHDLEDLASRQQRILAGVKF